MTGIPNTNPADIQEFFKKTIPDQIHLTAIDPTKGRRAVGKDSGTDAEAASRWALRHNAEGFNVYFTTNRVRPGLGAERNKGDIVGVRFAHVDVDPPKGAASFTPEQREAAYERLKAASPSMINWSGNGLQALWRLEESVSIDEVEQINRGLIEALGGDKGTHDASRLLRVPGLINWPDAKKSAAGRVPALAQIVDADTGVEVNTQTMLKAFPAADKPRERNPTELGEVRLLTADDLGLPSDAYLRKLIDEPHGLDRSADVFHFACQAMRDGLRPEQVVGVLLHPHNAISSHCLDQLNPRRAANRAIDKALGEEGVRTLAKRHAHERERALAAGECNDPSDVTKLWTLEAMLQDCIFIEDGAQVVDTTRPRCVLTQSDFRSSTAASKMVVEVPGKNGSTRKINRKVAEIWLEHPNRRSAATMTFRPGAPMITVAPNGQNALNTWSGFRFLSSPDDWALCVAPFVEHIGWLWGKDADAFLDWLAHIVQRPGELPSIAWLHIAKRTGMGRNWVATVLGRVFVGYAALAFNLSGTLRTGYNGLLAGKVLAVVDEIDEGSGQRKYQIQQELKQLVTEETRTINPKYGRQHVEWNVCRWLIFSNSTTALPLEDDDRRFWVVQCDEGPKSTEYYARLYALKDDPAFIASVAEYLSWRDLSHFKQGQRAPMTSAKASLLERTRPAEEQILHDIVERWPVDIIISDELHTLLGDDRPKGAALRYALERAGIEKVGDWKAPSIAYPDRSRITAYAVRSKGHWKGVTKSAMRAEVNRMGRPAKEAAFHGDAEDLC
jgi:hypothetical protein